MINYKSTAFSYRENIDGRTVSGNPSSIFLLEEGEEFSREVMSKLGISENYPITCFIKKIDNSARNYNIFYYNLDGSQAYMCGSGTMSTAFILNRLFNINQVNFYFDTTPFKVKIDNNLITASIEKNDVVFLERQTHSFSPVVDWNSDMETLVESFQIDRSLVVEILEAIELNDLIFVLDDSMVLRKMRPNFKQMATILEKLDIRNLCVTTLSSHSQFDFEMRIFIPHDNLNEDLACGSSSLAVSRYWSEKTGKNNLSVLFPYHMEYDGGVVGGVQFIEILNDKTMIGGHCGNISQDFKIVNYPEFSNIIYSTAVSTANYGKE
jgi:PhzF family phenazine biosynthesis protein